LRFGIVQVIQVDTAHAKVAQAASELVFQKARSQAVAPGNDFLRRKDARLNVFVKKIFVGIGRHGAVGGQVTAFGANHEFVARDIFLGQQLDGCSDAALAALKSIVDGCVDYVDAALDGRDYS